MTTTNTITKVQWRQRALEAERELDEIANLVSTLTGYDGDEDAVYALEQAIHLAEGEHLSDIVSDRDEARQELDRLRVLMKATKTGVHEHDYGVDSPGDIVRCQICGVPRALIDYLN